MAVLCRLPWMYSFALKVATHHGSLVKQEAEDEIEQFLSIKLPFSAVQKEGRFNPAGIHSQLIDSYLVFYQQIFNLIQFNMSASPQTEPPATKVPPIVKVELVTHEDVVEALKGDHKLPVDEDVSGTLPGGPQGPPDEGPDADPAVHTRTIVGPSTFFPYRTVGKIFAGRGGDNTPIWTGAGVIVGPNMVLTSARIIPKSELGNWWMRFVPAQKESTAPLGSSFVDSMYGYQNSVTGISGLDYMVCRLVSPLGRDNTGYVGTFSSDKLDDYIGTLYDIFGYPNHPSTNPNGLFMDVQHDCRFLSFTFEANSKGKRILTDLARPLPGAIGGPMWASFNADVRVVGVVSGPNTNRQYLVAGGGAHG
jgi:V8-like Glu-specific endopeptidase